VDPKGNTIQNLQCGPYAKQICALLKYIVVTTIRCGDFVNIDDVPLKNEHLDEWKAALQNFRVFYIGLSAPIDILEERERKRENRIQGSARAQFQSCGLCTYDLLIDSSQHKLPEQVALIRTRTYPGENNDTL